MNSFQLPKNAIRQAIFDAITRASAAGDLPGVVELQVIKVEYPKDSRFGDYSSPIALETAKIFHISPMQIGEHIARHLRDNSMLAAVEVVKPGFLNIFISQEFVCDMLHAAVMERDDFGRIRKDAPRRVSIEFVSANPTGPLNVVSARAGALGDSISNILEFTGDSVEREFYVNDYGNQVYLLGKSVLCRLKELKGEKADFPEDGYHGEYIRDIARFIYENRISELQNLKEDEELIEYLSIQAMQSNITLQKSDLEKFNVRFSRWFSERTLHETGKVDMCLEILESKNCIYESEGRKIFRSTDFGDDKDRVVVRDDGRPTYFLADIAYHLDKISRGYDLIIDIWGPDHHGHIKRLAGAMKALGFDRPDLKILIAQQVNLVSEGETVKMSKRLGTFSTLRDLLVEIGVDVARYFFVTRSLESHLDFDLSLAKKESSENPVFYLQYAHARICSIFRESDNRGFGYVAGNFRRDLLKNDEALALMKLLIKFPEEITDAADTLEPHRIASFLLRIAQAYHRFYTEHKVLAEDREVAQAFLSLCDAVRIVMKNGLRLLGVSAPEKMWKS